MAWITQKSEDNLTWHNYLSCKNNFTGKVELFIAKFKIFVSCINQIIIAAFNKSITRGLTFLFSLYFFSWWVHTLLQRFLNCFIAWFLWIANNFGWLFLRLDAYMIKFRKSFVAFGRLLSCFINKNLTSWCPQVYIEEQIICSHFVYLHWSLLFFLPLLSFFPLQHFCLARILHHCQINFNVFHVNDDSYFRLVLQ